MNCPYTSTLLAPGFWTIEENGVRMFLLEGNGEALLIDAGFGTGDLKAYLTTLTTAPVTCVIVTHSDMDHVGSLSQFDHILMHPAEFSRFADKGGDLSRVSPLWEGAVITIGSRKLEVLLVAAHTPGCIVLLDREHRFLLGSDVVQEGPIYMFGDGRCLPAFPHAMDRLATLVDAFDIVYPSHNKLPLAPDIIPVLKEGALQVLAGQVADEPPIREGMPCRLYRWKNVSFLYDP